MKNLFIVTAFVFSLIITSSCSHKSDNNYTVSFRLTGIDTSWLIMQQRKDGNWVKIDSVKLENGKGKISGYTKSPAFYYINLKNTRNYMSLFIEPGEITVTADAGTFNKPVVEGSESQKLYSTLDDKLIKFDKKAGDLGLQYQQAKQNKDDELAKKIVDEYDQLETEKARAIVDFAVANNTSVVAPFVMMNYSYLFDLNDLKKVNDTLDVSITGSEYATSLNNRVKTLENVEIGHPFPDFTLNDPNGNPVALSSVAGKGNYVLVDFWASWCKPCRAENPNVVKAFNTYHDKGFDIFGVSLDKDHDKWVKAISDDHLAWTQVSDLKYWGSTAGKLYGVQSIPHNVLIDPKGIIIAQNLRGEDLNARLAKIFK